MAKKILVVEDEKDVRDLEVRNLKKLGFDVREAEDGQKALASVQKDPPHLVLLDMMLPQVDGFGVLENIRHYPDEDVAKTPVIILSNLWSDKDIIRAQSLKIDAYFVKAHTSMQEVMEKVQEILRAAETAGLVGK